MPPKGSTSISLWSGHAKAIEDYAKSLPYPPTTPQMVKRAVSLKIPVKKLLGSPTVRAAVRTISEADEEGVILRSVTMPDEVAKALADMAKDAKDDIMSLLEMAKEPSPTYCAGLLVLLFIETESPGFLAKQKKELLAAE